MLHKCRSILFWSYASVAALTFIGLAFATCFEGYVRWTLNQNYSALSDGAFVGLALLVAAQVIGLVWLSRTQ